MKWIAKCEVCGEAFICDGEPICAREECQSTYWRAYEQEQILRELQERAEQSQLDKELEALGL